MCRLQGKNDERKRSAIVTETRTKMEEGRGRRSKRDKDPSMMKKLLTAQRRIKHGDYTKKSSKGGGGDKIVGAILPSLIGVGIGVFALMAKMGFRGRATVAGIDLGTTNSVICVQAPSKSGR